MLKRNFNISIRGLMYTIINRGDCYQAYPLKTGLKSIPLFFKIEGKHTKSDICKILNNIATT